MSARTSIFSFRHRFLDGISLSLAAPGLLFLLLPLGAIILAADPGGLLGGLSERSTRDALTVSLRTSAVATLLIIVLGSPLSVALARRGDARGGLLENLVSLPLVLPPSVAGIALLMTFGREGLIGGWLQGMGIDIAFSATAVVLAQTFVAAPLFIRTFAASLRQIDGDILEASMLCGAGPWQRFIHVTLPLAWPGFMTGAALAWCRALGEFGATIIFAGNLQGETQTMPLAIYLGFESSPPAAITLSVLLLIFTAAVLILIQFIQNHKTS
jgi:molybdate transport system permease protein